VEIFLQASALYSYFYAYKSISSYVKRRQVKTEWGVSRSRGEREKKRSGLWE
jgi:hypothetical protein